MMDLEAVVFFFGDSMVSLTSGVWQRLSVVVCSGSSLRTLAKVVETVDCRAEVGKVCMSFACRLLCDDVNEGLVMHNTGFPRGIYPSDCRTSEMGAKMRV